MTLFDENVLLLAYVNVSGHSGFVGEHTTTVRAFVLFRGRQTVNAFVCHTRMSVGEERRTFWAFDERWR